MALIATTLFPGNAEGPLLKLEAPLSLWGGVNPENGEIINRRHPQSGETVGLTVLAIPYLIGSSSSSSVLLELIRNGHAPSALILGDCDAILVVGCLVGRELNYNCPPIVHLDPAKIERLASGPVAINAQDHSTAQLISS